MKSRTLILGRNGVTLIGVFISALRLLLKRRAEVSKATRAITNVREFIVRRASMHRSIALAERTGRIMGIALLSALDHH
jgi:hypothetical protein